MNSEKSKYLFTIAIAFLFLTSIISGINDFLDGNNGIIKILTGLVFLLILTPTLRGKKHIASDEIEKFIYSTKYLPQLLYFGTLLAICFLFYFDPEPAEPYDTIFFFWFLYITYLAVKNIKKK